MITKELIDSLSSDRISKKEYGRIIGLIDTKVEEIWKFIIEKSGREMKWWAFSNDVYDGDGNGSSGGEFDPFWNKEFIGIIGECSDVDNDFYEYHTGFPTNLLYSENFKDEVIAHIEKAKKAKEVRKLTERKPKGRKVKVEEMMKSIRSKVTEEEWKLISKKIK